MTEEIHNAIEAMYAAFAGVEKPVTMQYDTPYITEAEVQALLDTPLRELEWELLEKYNYSAPKLLGTERDYFYFLPRMIELLDAESCDFFGVCEKVYALPPLSKEQKASLERLLLLLWQEELRRDPWQESPADFVLRFLLELLFLGLDTGVFLDALIHASDKRVTMHLASALASYASKKAHKQQLYFLLYGDSEAARYANATFENEIIPRLLTAEVEAKLLQVLSVPPSSESEEVAHGYAAIALEFWAARTENLS